MAILWDKKDASESDRILEDVHREAKRRNSAFIRSAIAWSGFLLVAIVLSLAIARCEERDKKPDKGYQLARLAIVAATVADIRSSTGLRETNPIIGQSGSAKILVPTATTAVSLWLAHRLERSGHRKAAKTILMIGAGGHIAAAAHNWSQK
jgi:hypothetical protein